MISAKFSVTLAGLLIGAILTTKVWIIVVRSVIINDIINGVFDLTCYSINGISHSLENYLVVFVIH